MINTTPSTPRQVANIVVIVVAVILLAASPFLGPMPLPGE